ncbi:MAG: hypothetical protein ACTSXO_06160 [Candidatus Heimdallarchaeota archaeon]
MQNINVIIDALAIPFGSIATIVIISKNKRNVVNILMGLTVFFGSVASIIFALLKELYFFHNLSLAIFFAKMTYFCIYFMTIPVFHFSIFFWRSQNKNIPRFLHFLVFLPILSLSLWLFLQQDIIHLSDIYLGDKFYIVFNYVSIPFTIYSSVIMLFTVVLLIVELQLIAQRTKDFPSLKRRMHILAAVFALGFLGSLVSIFFVQFLTSKVKYQPAVIFVIASTISISLILLKTISREHRKLWHGCPKLLREKDGTTYCLNTPDGVPKQVKLLDLGNIIEKIQIEVDILRTGEENCANVLFSDNENNVRCLTTHEYIMVLDEIVQQKEMELAQEMAIMENNKLCSECLHKIIAYRKTHKDKSDAEIRTFFLGVRAEEFFGLV